MPRIPGIPQGQFLPHSVWGVWFIVECILADRSSVVLIADDMGLGKTDCRLAMLLYLKHIIDEIKRLVNWNRFHGSLAKITRYTSIPPSSSSLPTLSLPGSEQFRH